LGITLSLTGGDKIIVMALGCTFLLFACFSLSALFAERRSMLYVGGFLMTSLSFLVFLGFFNIFFGFQLLTRIQIYFGLFIFCGFVMFDTQLIIEKAEMGNLDFVSHALELFLDLFNIFIRLVMILNSRKKK